MLTFYSAFSRLGVAQVARSLTDAPCHFEALDVLEAHVYSYDDNFQVRGPFLNSSIGTAPSEKRFPRSPDELYRFVLQGMLVHYTAQVKATKETYELETFVQPKKHYKIIKPVGPINRLKMLQV